MEQSFYESDQLSSLSAEISDLHSDNPLSPPAALAPMSPPQQNVQVSDDYSQQRMHYNEQNELIKQLYTAKPKEVNKKFGPPEIRPTQIQFDEEEDFLGKGNYGTVYKARCRGHDVAVKIPHKQNLSPEELVAFKQEVELMSNNVHPNIISLKGACTEPGNLLIVTERCVSDLESLLNDVKWNPTWYERMKMARDIAQGMVWLHDLTKIIHGDLKPANLLIDASSKVKITDFGFSQFKLDSPIKDQTTKGSLIWMAPEKMQRKDYTDKVDVFSFAIILWEITTRQKPYAGFTDPTAFYRAVCFNKERPPFVHEVPLAVKNLIIECWSDNPDERPSFKDIAYRLDSIIAECVVREVHASRYWKEHYLSEKNGLFEYVDWGSFVYDLRRRLGNFDDEYFETLQKLLVETKQEGGRKLQIVSMIRFDMVSKWFPYFFTRERGVAVINEVIFLMQQPWFHGDIASDLANTALSEAPADSFLIRLSSKDPLNDPFTLSLKSNQHRRISRSPHGGFSMEDVIYPNLFDIVARNRHRLKVPAPKNYKAKY